MRAYQLPFRWVLSAGIAIWSAVALLIAWAGTLPDGYLIQVRGITAAQPYPVGAIVTEVCIVALSLGLMTWAAMANGWKRVGKVLIAFLVSGCVGVFAALGAMHAPDHYVYFALSMLAIGAASLLTLVVLAVLCLVGHKTILVREPEVLP